jgi:hypothetical protein
LFAQTEIAPGARGQIAELLNKPAMVKPAAVTPLGRSWFTLEADAHVFTDQVSFRQVQATFNDLDHQNEVFDGKKGKLLATVVSRSAGETVFDFVAVTIAPLGIQLKTPYRASVKITRNTGSVFAAEIRQLSQNSDTNKNIKNLFAARYAEEVTINGKNYTYIRIYTINEVNSSVLPNAKNVLENNTAPVNEESLQLIIEAAKKR